MSAKPTEGCADAVAVKEKPADALPEAAEAQPDAADGLSDAADACAERAEALE